MVTLYEICGDNFPSLVERIFQKQIIKAALSSVATRVDVLVRCDTRPPTRAGESMDEDVETYVSTLQGPLLANLIVATNPFSKNS